MTKARSGRELYVRRVLVGARRRKKTEERANIGKSRKSSVGKRRRRQVIKREVRVGRIVEDDGLDNRRRNKIIGNLVMMAERRKKEIKTAGLGRIG